MSTNELVPLTVAGIGLYVVLVRRNLWVGLATLALAGAWFIAAVYVVMPAWAGVGRRGRAAGVERL